MGEDFEEVSIEEEDDEDLVEFELSDDLEHADSVAVEAEEDEEEVEEDDDEEEDDEEEESGVVAEDEPVSSVPSSSFNSRGGTIS